MGIKGQNVHFVEAIYTACRGHAQEVIPKSRSCETLEENAFALGCKVFNLTSGSFSGIIKTPLMLATGIVILFMLQCDCYFPPESFDLSGSSTNRRGILCC